MSFKPIILSLTVLLSALSLSGKTIVEWSTLGNTTDDNSKPIYTQRFVITGDTAFERLAFNQFARQMQPVDPSVNLIEIVPGYYCLESPRFATADNGDKIIIDIITSGTFRSICYAPDGVHLVMADGTTTPVEFTRTDITADPSMWQSPSGADVMPYGEEIFELNEWLVKEGGKVGFYDVIPSYKKVTTLGGTSTSISTTTFVDKIIEGKPEWFRATIKNGTVTIETAPENRLRAQLRLNALNLTKATNIPNAVIEDYPDFGYRGIMIDIARNYQTPEQLNRVLQLMSRYNLNILHFHFADDEAWRLEIPGMPELTEVGGRRGYTTDEQDYLAQIFTGDGSPSSVNSSNGFFTRTEFIKMLKTANTLGISVLPEIESPGHARAAIKAMEKRFRTTGDDTYRLIDPADTSRYTSAQAFHDNVMNPAIPGPVKFMTYVASEIKKMYLEAGVELPAIHIGGDEVARGAWKGSPIAQTYMEEHGISNERDLHLTFITELVKQFAEMGIPVSGWQEIAIGHDETFNSAIQPHLYSVNCWSTLGKQKGVTAESARTGYPTVLSNVNHFYLDMCYSAHPYERGLSWGGYVDEFDALHGYAAKLCPVEPQYRQNIIGVSGQLFGETIRSGEMLESMLLPKMLGLAERAWNSTETYTDPAFNAIINTREFPLWQADGYGIHVRQPGIKPSRGLIVINTSYGKNIDVEIHYTTDGTEPTKDSPVYKRPIAIPASGEVRAKTYIGPHESVTTIFYL